MKCATIKKSGKYLLAALPAAFCTIAPASADVIPFFSTYPQIDMKTWYMSDGWANSNIQGCVWRAKAISIDKQNIKITIDKVTNPPQIRPYFCGEIHTVSPHGFGTYEASIKTAAASGTTTTFFTYTGPGVGVKYHDEIDFEFQGKNSHTVQLNYWVNGVSSDGTIINLGYDASEDFHTYGFTWTPSFISWTVDGKEVHRTKPGKPMPTHPGDLYMSLWNGTSLINGWLGPYTYTGPVSAEYAWVSYTPINAPAPTTTPTIIPQHAAR